MALNTSKCNYLTPLRFKSLIDEICSRRVTLSDAGGDASPIVTLDPPLHSFCVFCICIFRELSFYSTEGLKLGAHQRLESP